MYVNGRQSTRHMKGRQVPLTLYLPPQKYWLLKWLSRRKGETMQSLLRAAVDEILEEAARLRE